MHHQTLLCSCYAANTGVAPNVKLTITINSFPWHNFPDNFPTFPRKLSKSRTFPGCPDKWSPWKYAEIMTRFFILSLYPIHELRQRLSFKSLFLFLYFSSSMLQFHYRSSHSRTSSFPFPLEVDDTDNSSVFIHLPSVIFWARVEFFIS